MSRISPSANGLLSGVKVVVVTTALTGLALFTPPAHAQILGTYGQRSTGPVRNAPPSQSPVQVRSGQSQQSSQPSYSQPSRDPVYGQVGGGYAPIFRGGSPVVVTQPAPAQEYPVGGPTAVTPGTGWGRPGYQPDNQNSDAPIQRLPPSITYRHSGQRSGVDQSLGFSRRYSNGPQLLRPISPRGRDEGRGGLDNSPIQGSIRITTPVGQRPIPRHDYDGNYLYAPVTVIGGPTLLGGYYYGNYCNSYYTGYTYPSVYGCYDGFPEYIYNPGVVIVGDPYYPVYATSYLPFSPPVYQVTYNQTNYYVASEGRVQAVKEGGDQARHALRNAYPEGTYQAAFADIERAWTDSDLTLLQKHIRDRDTKLSVYFKGKYSYSIASGDFLQITRDAFDRLSTVSFQFTRLRKAKNGDVTAYGRHVYASSSGTDLSGDQATTGDTVPFSTDGSQPATGARPYDRADDPGAGESKTIYVSYTLRKQDQQWYIIGVDSSPTDLVK